MTVLIGCVFYTTLLHKPYLSKQLLKTNFFTNCVDFTQNKNIQYYWRYFQKKKLKGFKFVRELVQHLSDQRLKDWCHNHPKMQGQEFDLQISLYLST